MKLHPLARRIALTAALATTAVTQAALAPTAFAADAQILFVHGYGSSAQGKDCNGSTWKNALAYYEDAGGRERSSMSTVGYYRGDAPEDCDVIIGDGKASNERPIQDIATDLANYVDDTYTSKGQPVDIIGHSMGGLITRVALLGSAQDWAGFPSKLNVSNVVTLSTPHQGVANPSAHSNRQWGQMHPDSGFMERLHEQGSGLGDGWAQGTEPIRSTATWTIPETVGRSTTAPCGRSTGRTGTASGTGTPGAITRPTPPRTAGRR